MLLLLVVALVLLVVSVPQARGKAVEVGTKVRDFVKGLFSKD